jgi:hypothetical protein
MENTSEVTNATGRTDRGAKRSSVSLTAGKGETLTRLTILARRTRGDGGETIVTITDAKKKAVRGMTTKHDTFELAVAALGKLAQDAMRKGWQRSERAGGFKARPDAFAVIPAAPKASK